MDNETKEYIEERLSHFQKDIVHQFHIIAEDVIDKVKIVAEGVAMINEKLDRRTDELEKKIDDTQAMMIKMYKQLDKKIDENTARLDKKISETNKEVKEIKTNLSRIENKIDIVAERVDDHERIMHHL